ncbi:PRC-barrel domain-containing protein [Metabacillus malikii]|uniref:Uncharacterized protein YrrD n=1 Tax=Metabacillus malikii TaxID=1504265 RepID=A0ABT9ZGX4_9BACI|nr:PRC-barrel domain-containing protein [Metabacillus malikii]MDQ0231536.1 uncharacterized protein YrrD [Metabacillus malikii]
MRTFSTLKGMPVYCNKSATLLGYVTDLYLSPQGQIFGLLMEGKGLINRDKFVPFEVVDALGENGVMVKDRNSLQPVHAIKTNQQYIPYDDLHFKSVLTREGEKLGLLEDVYISEKMGTIEAYELTDGFFADITEGKKVVKASGEPLTISKDAIVMDFS